MIFDSHAHLCDPAFNEDREETIEGLLLRGIGAFTEIGYDLSSSEAAAKLAAARRIAGPEIYAAVGIHPDHSDSCTEDALRRLQQLAAEPRVVAIGEIGLDYHYTREGILKRAEASGRAADPEELEKADPEPEVQKETFRKMLRLSRACRLPINVHSREAAQDTLEIISEEKGYENGGIIHCFGYSADMARRFTALGLMIGIGGVLTFKNVRKLVEAAKAVPLEAIVLETDCPYMAPVPHRGERNDPGNLSYIAEKLAEIRGISTEEVIRITTENARRVYRIS